MRCFALRMSVMSVIVALAIVAPGPARADLVAAYDFANSGTTIPNQVPSTGTDMLVRPNGTGFADANLFGVSDTGLRLGQAGLMTEPAEPATQTGNYGFWAPKALISGSTEWTILAWFNRRDLNNSDMIFYIGTGDGFGGTGAEMYVYSTSDGHLLADNFRNNSTLDMRIEGGAVAAHQWHQAALVGSNSTFSLYLDGELLGKQTGVSPTALTASGNSAIVFGAAKWMNFDAARRRVLDGMIDQVEIYNHALAPGEIQARYSAFAVPLPSALAMAGALGGVLALRGIASRVRLWTRQQAACSSGS